jgi:hypothetical protein
MWMASLFFDSRRSEFGEIDSVNGPKDFEPRQFVLPARNQSNRVAVILDCPKATARHSDRSHFDLPCLPPLGCEVAAEREGGDRDEQRPEMKRDVWHSFALLRFGVTG